MEEGRGEGGNKGGWEGGSVVLISQLKFGHPIIASSMKLLSKPGKKGREGRWEGGREGGRDLPSVHRGW